MDLIKGLGRRELLIGSAATAAIGLLPSLSRAATPKSGGNFRQGVGDFAVADSLDPTLYQTYCQLYLFRQLRNNLVEIGPGGVLIPELAESWEGSKDAKTWVFKLRKGVEFHNGKPFTAADVVYSLNLHRKPGTPSTAAPMLEPVVDVRATGDLEVTVELKSGNVGLPDLMTLETLSMVPDGTTDFSKGIGTGGYVLENFEPGVKALVKRNKNYWKEGRAHFDSVETICIKDAAARTSALVSGEIDACNFVDLKTVNMLKRKPGINVISTAGKAHYTFPALMDAKPFDNKDVRTAFKYAINREEMVKVIANGYATVGNDQPITPSYKFHNPDIKPKAYDPDKAKFYLKKAGYDKLSVQLYVSEVPYAGATDASVLYREQAAKAGIDIEVVKTPEDGYWNDIWNKKPFCAARWSGRVNEDVMISLVYSADGMKAGWNETHMNDERVNSMLVAARVEFDEAKRRQIYYDLQQIISEDGGAITPVIANFVDATSSKVQHGEIGSDFSMDGARASERWWFA